MESDLCQQPARKVPATQAAKAERCRTWYGLGCLLPFLLCGCTTVDETPQAPALEIAMTLDHFSGSPLSGPAPFESADTAPSTALPVVVHLLACRTPPQSTLTPLSAVARLILASGDDAPLKSAPTLTRGAHYGRLGAESALFMAAEKDAGCRLLGTLRTALPPGITAVFTATRGVGRATREEYGEVEKLELQVHREALESARPDREGAVEIALAVEALREPGQEDAPTPAASRTERAPSEDADGRPGDGSVARELVVLGDIGASAPAAFVFVLPSPFRSAVGANVTAVLELLRPPSPHDDGADDRPELVARCLRDVERSLEKRRMASAWQSARRSADDLEQVIRGLDAAGSPRSALVFLASVTGARLTEAVALTSDEDLVARLAASIVREREESAPAAGQAELGLLLERKTLQLAAEILSRPDAPAGLEAVLAEHTGGVYRYPSALYVLARQSESLGDMDARLVHANRSLLWDNTARIRCRAHDWLARRDVPTGAFDPLAPESERRRILLELFGTQERRDTTSHAGARREP